MEGLREPLHTRSNWLSKVLAASALVIIGSGFTAANAVTITAAIGSTNGGSAAYAFVGGSDGNVWLNTNYGGTFHWQNLAPLNVSYGAGVLSPGGNPAAYAVGTDGNLYIIHQVGSSWSAALIPGKPSAVTLVKWVGTIQNSSNQPFIFLVGSDGNLWLAHNAGSWNWTNIGNPGAAITAGVGAINISPSYPQAFVQIGSGAVYQAAWNGSGYTWRSTDIACGICLVSAGNSDSDPWVFNTQGSYLWNGSSYPFAVYHEFVPSLVGAKVGITVQDNWPVFIDSTNQYIYFGYLQGYSWYTNDFTSVTGTTINFPVGVEDTGTGIPYAYVVGANGNLYLTAYTGTVSNLGVP